MKQFEFYQDFKVAVWRRQNFTIEAESYEEALKSQRNTRRWMLHPTFIATPAKPCLKQKS